MYNSIKNQKLLLCNTICLHNLYKFNILFKVSYAIPFSFDIFLYMSEMLNMAHLTSL
jgi:hypothetical protein